MENQGSNEDDELSERRIYSRRPVNGLSNSKNIVSDDNLVFRDNNQPQIMVSDVPKPGLDPDRDNFLDEFAGKNGFMTRMISFSKKSKREVLELRQKLEGERDLVRTMMRKIEANEGPRNVSSDFGSARNKNSKPPSHQLSVSVDSPVSDNLEKDKRTPKANKFYRNTEFLLAKDKIPVKESNKKLKPNVNKDKVSASEIVLKDKFPSKVLKSCIGLLERLMKHKHGWVFNKPVDAKALGLHDYFDIIKHPMDLGTVKDRLTQNWYESPLDFAEDVRTTFRNAMTYNPKGQDVYVMAEQLLKIFEEKWGSIENDDMQEVKVARDNIGSRMPKSKKGGPTQPRGHIEMDKSKERSELVVTKKGKAVNSGKVSTSKKPKAKDPDKREMTYDEKRKLSINLQSLPSEKLESVVHIIKKRNPSLAQEDNEIEVDIDSVDIETLWELDRFVTNYKKNLSKNKRKAESVDKLASETEHNTMGKSNAPSAPETPKGSRTDKEKSVDESVRNDTKVASQSSSTTDSGSASHGSDNECSS